MYYYVIRDRKGEMISVFKDNVKIAARSVVVRITKAEFDTYLEFGIEELDASVMITSTASVLIRSQRDQHGVN